MPSKFIQRSVKYCTDPTEVFVCNFAFCFVNGLQTMLFCCKHMSVKLVTGVTHKDRVNTCLQNETVSVFCDILLGSNKDHCLQLCILGCKWINKHLAFKTHAKKMSFFYVGLLVCFKFYIYCECKVES